MVQITALREGFGGAGVTLQPPHFVDNWLLQDLLESCGPGGPAVLFPYQVPQRWH